ASESERESYVKEVSKFLGPRFSQGEDDADIESAYFQLVSYVRETVLQRLYADTLSGRSIRRLLLIYRRLRFGVPKVDVFHFDFQGKQTQLDSSIPDAMSKNIEDVLND